MSNYGSLRLEIKMEDMKESEIFFHSLPFEAVGIKKAMCIAFLIRHLLFK